MFGMQAWIQGHVGVYTHPLSTTNEYLKVSPISSILNIDLLIDVNYSLIMTQNEPFGDYIFHLFLGMSLIK